MQEDAKVPVGNLVAVIAAQDEDNAPLIGATAAPFLQILKPFIKRPLNLVL